MNNNESCQKTSINWYPGHMAKTKRLIGDELKNIDIVYEVIDARIPFSSKIKDIDNLIKNKHRILIMTKKDLCDLLVTKKWMKYYEEKGYVVLLMDLKESHDYKKIVESDIEQILSSLSNEIEQQKQTREQFEHISKALIDALSKDIIFSTMSLNERNRVTDRMLSTIQGQLM